MLGVLHLVGLQHLQLDEVLDSCCGQGVVLLSG